MVANAIYKMHWSQVAVTLIFSIVLALAATVFLSIYWPAIEPTERMAAGALNSVIIWLLAMLVGLLAKNSWRAALWLGGSSFTLIAVIAAVFSA